MTTDVIVMYLFTRYLMFTMGKENRKYDITNHCYLPIWSSNVFINLNVAKKPIQIDNDKRNRNYKQKCL